jgi:MoaA/NifB/PqqE/SkfB family radical SAM enzyme
MDAQNYSWLKDRQIILWGAGNQGRGLRRKLEKNGFPVTAFVDQNIDIARADQEIAGYPVHHPNELGELKKIYPSPVLIITPFFLQDALIGEAEKSGYVEGVDLFRLENLTPHIYVVDISGACNLKCISCPHGSGRKQGPPAGFMSASTFKRVIEKITGEDPLAASVQLYQWGEPLLNRDLPEIITIARNYGLAPAISSNLNAKVDLSPIVEAGPNWFRASLSGFGPRYDVTHTGGKFTVFREHLENLHALTKKYCSMIKVQVFYHLYKDNRGEDLREAREFCQSKGFEFHPVWAYLISLDEVLEYLETGYLPDEARKVADMLEISLERALALAKADSAKKCLVENVIPINWDLSVSNCMMYYYRENNLAVENFLETPLSELTARRKHPPICARCKKRGLHRYCEIYNNYPTDDL